MINEHIEDLYRLSPIQQGILFHSLYNPHSGMYFEQFGWNLRGNLDVAVFIRAWQHVMDRHPILRTAFFWKDLPEPLQMVHRKVELPVDLLDWSDLPRAKQEARLEQLFDADRQRGFDLTVAPLMRLTLIRLEPDFYQALWSYHHLLLDGWSVALLMEEVTVVYEAFSAGKFPRLERRRPYREYIAWLRQRDLAQAEAFWRRVMQGFAEPIALGSEPAQGDASSQPEAYGLQALTLPPATVEGLQALTRRYQVTLNTLAQGAWALLLSRYSGRDDVVFGTTVSGRPIDIPGSKTMIGLFINTLPIRVRLPAEAMLQPWLQEIQALLVELRQYEYSPLVEVHGWSDVPRGQPLFESILVFQNYRVDETGRMRNIRVFQKNNYPLTVVIEPGATISLRIGYDTHRFDDATIARMLQHLRTVLESFVADPDQRLADIELLSADERRQLLVEWNDTRSDYPDGPTITQLFEAHAARTPDAVAVVFERPTTGDKVTRRQGDKERGRGGEGERGRLAGQPQLSPQSSALSPEHLTYAELNARANQLAHTLRELGVGPERLVGIYMERSAEMIVALLGVLKAGGVYVPLDPSYPQDRLAFMFADTRMPVLVTRRQFADGLSERPPHVVCIDSDWATLAQASPDPVCAAVTPANAMYVIYTSGSTGRPKGVVVEQRQVLNYVYGILERLDGIPGAVTAMVQPLAVDSCVTVIYPPLCSGGRLHVIPESIALDPIALSAYFDRCPVDCLKIAPSHLAALQTGPRPDRLLPRRQLIIGGEASQWSWVAQLRAMAPACTIVNHYGPTEATVGMLTYRVGLPSDDQVGALPLGRPLPNTRAYVLDRRLRPVPVGVPGELYIGGACLARGYLNRPELTAAAFVPDPFADEPGTRDLGLGTRDQERHSKPLAPSPKPLGQRLYRTGDLMRYRADGNIEFLGRADDQIKIRGFRVELGEIEAQIRQHPAVREAVVAIREDASKHRQLVAYIVPATDKETRRQGDKESGRAGEGETGGVAEPQPSVLSPQPSALPSSFILHPSSLGVELRDFLRGKLPEYMVPASFMLLEALPLTPHGKLDRRALPAPDASQPDSDGEFVAPRTPVEEVLAQIWADVLGVPRVGADDSFFALGGHSLMATQLISRVHATFQVELPIRTLFEARTVAGMARRIEAARHADQGHAPPPIHRVPRDGALPLSFAQQRLWFLDQIEPGSPTYNIPAAVYLSGCLDVRTLQRSIDAIVCRHEVLRTTFAAVEGRPVQTIAPALSMPLPVADMRDLPADGREAAARRMAIAEARRPFDLARGPLLRAALLRLADDEHILLLTMHHIVFDGWSMGVFVRELVTLYGAISAGQPAPLPDLPLQYVDVVAWQREWLQGPVLQSQLAYWKRQLADLPVLELPTDRPRPLVPSFRGQIFAFTLPEELKAAITALNRREETTQFMLLLAAFQTLLYRYTGQEDVGVGTPIAGRTRAETEQLIGCFINMQVLRTSLAGNPTFRELLGRVREITLDAYAHQDLPFERLVEELQPERDLNRSPLFQVLFSLQNTPLPDLTLPGLSLRPIGIDNQTAKYDLSLAMQETRHGMVAQLEYKADLFDAATIARMAGHFQTILQSVVADPDLRIADLPLLTGAERQQMLVEWNSLTIDYPQGKSIHACVEKQVARTPDAVALVFDERPTTGDKETRGQGDKETRGQGELPSLSPQSSVPGPSHLTYRELNARANRVAHYLRTLGVGPDTRVAICLDRSLEMVVGLLGILKAGGAYVPLDPAYPQERLAFMLEDAQAPVLLTSKGLGRRDWGLGARDEETRRQGDKETRRQGDEETRRQGTLSQAPSPTPIVVCLDADHERIAAQPEENPHNPSAPENLAYVIYTSGSTGSPKGVMIDHRALVDHCYAVIKRCDMQPADRLLQFASLNSDIAVEDLFPTWLSGATVVLWPDPGVAAFDAFSRFADRERLTVLNLPTAYWHEWVIALATTATPVAPSLRLVIVGGEKALAERLSIWRRLAGARVRWNNAYGPTEATISTTIYEPALDEEQIAELDAIPIGRPIANTQIYLLDQRMRPVPVGIPGELYIGGARVARGYLGRPDLTAERFVPNPFADEPGTRDLGLGTRDQKSPPKPQAPSPKPHGERLYRTGDLARYRPDGNIEFLGRIDHQVKLRGFRIELREIEAALGEHQGVRDAVVLAREDTPGSRRLVAYVVPTNDQRLGDKETRRQGDKEAHGVSEAQSSVLSPQHSALVPELRAFLKQRLPDYMVPAAFVWLDALPLTANGKVDLRALPVPDTARPALDDAFVAPRTPIEVMLAGIWAEVLRLEQVGIHDNFFALGGDSILSIQIIARANQAGLQLTPRDLFQHQTIAALATVVDTAPAAVATQDLVIGPVPLTPIQQWFFAQDLPDPHHYNQDVMLELLNPLDEALLAQAIQHLIVHHDALRLRFRRSAGGWQQFNAGMAEQPVITRIDLAAVPPEQQSAAISAAAADLQASLNLAEGPLVRVGLFDCGPGRRGRLLLIIHHLAVDGVSWRVLLEDLQTVYAQLSRGAAITLPPKTTSFKQWAERLVAYAQSPTMRQELAYWLAMPWSRVAPLPLDHPGGANTMASARVVTVTLDAEETRALLREVPQAYHTQINDVLMTALAQALAPWTATSAVLIHLEGHGREDLFADVDLSRTVGWFTSIFPVLLDLQGADQPGGALKAIKEQLRRVPRRGVGFGILRYLSQDPQIAARMRALPQAEVSFNYLGQVDQVLPAEGLFGPARESSGATQSLLGRREHLLDVGGLIAGGQLHMRWAYSDTVHERATIERLALRFLAALRALIAHCRSPEAGGYTPSDFPLARIDQPTLDRLIGNGRQVEDLYSLTPLQEGMLFHTLHDTRPGMYIEQLSFPLYGELDVPALTRAWQQVVDRHAVFRSAFFWEGLKAPLQIVYRHVRQPWIEDDWRGLSPDEQEARLNVFLADDRRRGFALSQAPLMRLALFHTSADSYEFVWSCHHMLLDGWSMPIVMQEVFALYAAAAHGREVQLARPRPFRDYIAWLQKQDLAQAEAFWRVALAGFRAPTVLAIDRPAGPDARATGFGEQKLQIAEPTTAALLALARQHGLTVNTILQGAWALLLSRYSGSQDVVFGTTVAGRPADLAGAETMVGLFINTLPVRVGVPPDAAALPWLQRLQDQLAELRQYEYSPLVAIQGWSEVPRGRPLFESIVVFENYPVDTVVSAQGERARLKSEKVRVIERTNYPLTLTAGVERELSMRMVYNSSRFEAPAVARLLRHLAMLLEGIAAAPTCRLAELPLLTEEEWQQIRSWNATTTADQHDRCVHRGFELQAARTPDAVALVFGRPTTEQGSGVRGQGSVIAQGDRWSSSPIPGLSHLTYAELNERANRLAHHLRSLRVGPDARVGVCLERSPEMVVAVLAALKAGAAYVPLDPEYPQERLAFMLADARVPVLLTQRHLLARLPDISGTGDWELGARDEETRRQGEGERGREETPSQAPNPKPQTPSPTPIVVCLDAGPLPADGARTDNPDSGALPDNLAYVIYTSGSTGRPKGVAMPHRPLANLLAWQQRSAAVQGGARTLQFAPLSFDVSFQEIFATLCTGGTLILISEETRRDAAALARLLDAAAVERLFLPFIALQQLAMAIDGGLPAPTRLREIMTAGEQLQITQPILRTFARLPWCVLSNQYGPSESHVVTAYTLAGPPADWPALPPIGQPIDNARIELLDQSLRPVPIGVPGELHIGGIALARGYLDRPELTAERFIPNPFADEPGTRDLGLGTRDQKSPPKPQAPSPKPHGERLYRTGDLARYRADGNIEFLGRIDHQVKVRGFRVELGEIEVVLGQHASVHEAVVLARADRPGDTRLVAYLVPDRRPTAPDPETQRHADKETRRQGDKVTGDASDPQPSALSPQDSAPPSSFILHPSSLGVEELRAFVQKQLPEYMVPSAFVLLDRLPLTPSGKIDRLSLLAPDQGRPHLDAPFEAPRTPVEESLAAIWSEVLGVSPIGIHDNFFVLGGHSLLATQVVSRVREEFLVELPLRTVFTQPTLAGMADAIVEMAIEQADSELLTEMMDSIKNLPTDAA